MYLTVSHLKIALINCWRVSRYVQKTDCLIAGNVYIYTVASAPTNLMAVQEGLTSIRVSWSPPTPLGGTTGYRIYYSDGDSSDSVDVSDPSSREYLLQDLVMGSSYSLSLVATSQHLPSGTLTQSLQLVLGIYYNII